MEGDLWRYSNDPRNPISIHSLRMEGDCPFCRFCGWCLYFNPLPPHGGRLGNPGTSAINNRFQSTPSAWRETNQGQPLDTDQQISIHSLRMEGDQQTTAPISLAIYFNPLPPHGGRRQPFLCLFVRSRISIHSLRMEGDTHKDRRLFIFCGFQSTPSAWRETLYPSINSPAEGISIHSLRMEGDAIKTVKGVSSVVFQSTPSAWRETVRSVPVWREWIFQSTPSAWRETAKLHRKAFFISPILVQSCKKGCKRLHSAPEKMVFFEKREKNLVRNLQHLSVRL